MGKVTIVKARKILGKKYQKSSDKQIQQILDQLYGLADLVTDQVLSPGSNKNPAVIDSSIIEGQNGG